MRASLSVATRARPPLHCSEAAGLSRARQASPSSSPMTRPHRLPSPLPCAVCALHVLLLDAVRWTWLCGRPGVRWRRCCGQRSPRCRRRRAQCQREHRGMHLRELRLQRARCGGEQFHGSHRAPYGFDVDKQCRGCGPFSAGEMAHRARSTEKNTALKHRRLAFVSCRAPMYHEKGMCAHGHNRSLPDLRARTATMSLLTVAWMLAWFCLLPRRAPAGRAAATTEAAPCGSDGTTGWAFRRWWSRVASSRTTGWYRLHRPNCPH